MKKWNNFYYELALYKNDKNCSDMNQNQPDF